MYWKSDSVGCCLAVLMLEYLLSAIHYTCTLCNIINSLRIFGENVCFTTYTFSSLGISSGYLYTLRGVSCWRPHTTYQVPVV